MGDNVSGGLMILTVMLRKTIFPDDECTGESNKCPVHSSLRHPTRHRILCTAYMRIILSLSHTELHYPLKAGVSMDMEMSYMYTSPTEE